MRFPIRSYAPRLILRGTNAGKYIGFAKSQAFSLGPGGTRILKIDDATIRVKRLQNDQVYIDIQAGALGVLYEFFVPNIDSQSSFIDGNVIGVEFNARNTNDYKVIYKFALSELVEDGLINFDPTWTDVNWSGRTFYNTLFQQGPRIVSSYGAFSPEHMYGCYPLTSGMSTVDWVWTTVRERNDFSLNPNNPGIPAVYRGIERTATYGLTGTVGRQESGAFQIVESENFGSRRYFITTDNEGWFYVIPVGLESEAAIANLKQKRCAIPANVAQKGNNTLLTFEKVSFKFNSTGTKAVTTFADIGYEFGTNSYVHAFTPDGGVNFNIFATEFLKSTAPPVSEFIPAHASLPHLMEYEIKITIQGDSPEDFDFELEVTRDYLPNDRFVVGADYAIEHENFEGKGVDKDDLICLIHEVYAYHPNAYVDDVSFPGVFPGAKLKSVVNGASYVSFYNLDKDTRLVEYPLHTNVGYRCAMDVFVGFGLGQWSTDREFLSIAEGEPINQSPQFNPYPGDFRVPLTRGYIYGADLKTCSIAMRYEYYNTPNLFFSIVKLFQNFDQFEAYGIIYSFLDREVYFENQNDRNVSTERRHEQINRPKQFKVTWDNTTGGRSVFLHATFMHWYFNAYSSFSVHPDGHISFSAPPSDGDGFVLRWKMDLIAVWDSVNKRYYTYNHRDIFNLAFEEQRQYSDYPLRDPIGSFKSTGYWIV